MGNLQQAGQCEGRNSPRGPWVLKYSVEIVRPLWFASPPQLSSHASSRHIELHQIHVVEKKKKNVQLALTWLVVKLGCTTENSACRRSKDLLDIWFVERYLENHQKSVYNFCKIPYDGHFLQVGTSPSSRFAAILCWMARIAKTCSYQRFDLGMSHSNLHHCSDRRCLVSDWKTPHQTEKCLQHCRHDTKHAQIEAKVCSER